MPISNPLVTINYYGTGTIQAPYPPPYPPEAPNLLYVDSANRQMYFSVGNTSIDDWLPVSGNSVVLDRILVADGEVLTDGTNVLYSE